MTRGRAIVIALALALPACDGEIRLYTDAAARADAQIPVDASPDGNTSSDANSDVAPGCGTCTEEAPLCDVARSRCVKCLANQDCHGADAGRCDLALNECVHCLDAQDCPTEDPICDLVKHECTKP